MLSTAIYPRHRVFGIMKGRPDDRIVLYIVPFPEANTFHHCRGSLKAGKTLLTNTLA
jgi:hypothetical protein